MTPAKNRRDKPGRSSRVSLDSAGTDRQFSRYDNATSSSEITRTGFRGWLSAVLDSIVSSLAAAVAGSSTSISIVAAARAGATIMSFGLDENIVSSSRSGRAASSNSGFERRSSCHCRRTRGRKVIGASRAINSLERF